MALILVAAYGSVPLAARRDPSLSPRLRQNDLDRGGTCLHVPRSGETEPMWLALQTGQVQTPCRGGKLTSDSGRVTRGQMFVSGDVARR